MTALVISVSVVVYLAGWVITGRWAYGHMRPYSEPLNCDHCIVCDGECGTGREHHCYAGGCWKRPGGLATPAGAISASFVAATVWPLFLLTWHIVRALRWVIASGASDLPPEVEAKTKRLERELGIKN